MKALRWLLCGSITFGIGTAVLSACSNASISQGGPPQQRASQILTKLVITIPKSSSIASTVKRPAYVSPSTQSITVRVDDAPPTVQNLSPSSADCSGAGQNYPYTCTVPITASAGSHTFSFVTYDGLNASGNTLSTNSTVQTLSSTSVNLIAITLAGVPVALQVYPMPGALGITGNQTGLNFIGKQTQTLSIVSVDADGNDIVGPGAPALTVTVSNPSNGSGLAVSATSNVNEFVLTSSDPGTASLVVTATPASNAAGSGATVTVPLSSLTETATLAGVPVSGFVDGVGNVARFDEPNGVAFDAMNGAAYVSDTSNCAIRQITGSGSVTTIAGGGPNACGDADGTGSAALFDDPVGIAYDTANDSLYVTDTSNCIVRQVAISGVVTTLAGAGQSNCSRVDGMGTGAGFGYPAGIAFDSANGNLYVTDAMDCSVRSVTTTGVVSTLAGGTCGAADGTGSAAKFSTPTGITYDSNDDHLYVADEANCEIREVTLAGVVTTVAGTTTCGYSDGSGTGATFVNPTAITYSPIDDALYVGDLGNCLIRKVVSNGVVTTVAGSLPVPTCAFADGLGTAAAYAGPTGITYDSKNQGLVVTDQGNSAIRQIQL